MNKGSNSFPTLLTQRLTLRQLSTSDAQEIFQLRSNTEINKFLNRKPCNTLEEALAFINSIIENDGELFYWAITTTDNQKLIGTICLFDFSTNPNKCEIGYELLSEHQGHGYMIEALKKVTEYATEILKVKSIDAVTHKDNKSSSKLLLKTGFTEVEIPKDEPNLILFRL